MKHNSVWTSNWENRISERAKQLGFDTVLDFLVSVPTKPYREVIKLLGIEAAPAQMIRLQFHDAKVHGKIRETAKDGLCRNIVEKFPEGWGIGNKPEWQMVKTLSGWISEILVTGDCPELEEKLDHIADYIQENPPPRGWLPKSVDDPIITEAFDFGWPE